MDYLVIQKAKPKEMKVKPNLLDFEQSRMNYPWEARGCGSRPPDCAASDRFSGGGNGRLNDPFQIGKI